MRPHSNVNERYLLLLIEFAFYFLSTLTPDFPVSYQTRAVLGQIIQTPITQGFPWIRRNSRGAKNLRSATYYKTVKELPIFDVSF
jgi:hypothetical protein